MEKSAAYRQLIKDAVSAYAQPFSQSEIEVVTIFDDEREQYQLLHLGWRQKKRVYSVILHLRLHNGKIWIERDGTADGVAYALLANGVPHEQIVLAFHSPWKRQFTEFAVA